MLHRFDLLAPLPHIHGTACLCALPKICSLPAVGWCPLGTPFKNYSTSKEKLLVRSLITCSQSFLYAALCVSLHVPFSARYARHTKDCIPEGSLQDRDSSDKSEINLINQFLR